MIRFTDVFFANFGGVTFEPNLKLTPTPFFGETRKKDFDIGRFAINRFFCWLADSNYSWLWIIFNIS